MIEDTRSLENLVDELITKPYVAMDTEADSFHHYQEQVCLIQVSDLSRDYIIDPLKIDDCSSLKRLFGAPTVTTILHGGDYDVVSLKRDFDVHFSHLFDTMIASLFLGFPRIGLADLIEQFFGHHIDKKYQRHDWSRRPLLDEHLQYARGDTHFLLALREILRRKLENEGRTAAFEEECALLAQREWSGRARDPSDFMRTKRSNSLDKKGLRVLRALWNYREERAKALDRPVFKVLADSIMVDLSKQRPNNRDELHRVIRRNSSLARKHGDDLLKIIKAGVADETPLPRRKKSKSKTRHPPRPKGAPGIDRLYTPLKEWRNHVVESEGLSPVVVASNSLLKEIARAAPDTLEDLADVPGIRNWQVDDFGDEILDIINDVPVATARKRRARSS
ncbi:MAG: HRDC domain-containing protein [Myxococcota bacterium]